MSKHNPDGNQGIRVYRAILNSGESGMTSDEVSIATGMKFSGVSSRISELVRADCLIDTLERRITSKGKKSAVYRVDPQATEERYLTYMHDRSDSQPKKRVEPLLSWEDKVVRAARAYRKNKTPDNAERLLKMASSFTIGVVKVLVPRAAIDGRAL